MALVISLTRPSSIVLWPWHGGGAAARAAASAGPPGGALGDAAFPLPRGGMADSEG